VKRVKPTYIKNVFWFSLRLLSETFLILRRIQRDGTINVRCSASVSVRFSSQILLKLAREFRKILSLMIIRPV
jgi:hypothetical protein